MIPVFEPEVLPEDIQAVQAALARGEISGSFGKALAEFENEFAAYCGCKHGVATTSGTTALELASAAAGFGPGDEVLGSACFLHTSDAADEERADEPGGGPTR